MVSSFGVPSGNDMDDFAIPRIIKQASLIVPKMERLTLLERTGGAPAHGEIALEDKDDLLMPLPGLEFSPPLTGFEDPVDKVTGMTSRLLCTEDILPGHGYLARDIERAHIHPSFINIAGLLLL
jgi:hypothetical protein